MRPAETTYQVSNVTDDQLTLMVRQKTLTPEVEQALRGVLAKKTQIAAVDAEIKARKDETERIFADQERLRENLKALGSRAEEKSLVGRYTRQLEEQETRLDTIKRDIAERESMRQALQAELDAMVQGLAFGTVTGPSPGERQSSNGGSIDAGGMPAGSGPRAAARRTGPRVQARSRR